MSLISSQFGVDSESVWNLFSGIGRAVLGRNGKYNFNRSYSQYNSQTILIDTTWSQLMLVAQNVPHLNTILSEGAKMFSQAEIKHVDKDGNEIENSDVIKLLRKPNVLQSQAGWLYDFYIMNGIYNTAFEYKNYGRKKEYRGADLPSALWWLPSGNVKINRTDKLPYRQVSIEGIIESYQMSLDPEPFYPDEILLFTEGISNNGVIALTRIEAMQVPLSNIMAALKSKNIILTERGLIGFISPSPSKDDYGAQPMKDPERKRIEEQYQKNYSLDNERGHVTFASQPIQWNPMTFDMGQLKLPEGLEDDFALLCGAWGIHRNIFPVSHTMSAGMTTGNEIDASLRWTYQNTMQPLLNKLLEKQSEDFGLTARGEKLIGDYQWLACMKNDELKEAQAEVAEVTAQGTFSQTIINMNSAIKAGNMTIEGAIQILVMENEMDEADATVLILNEQQVSDAKLEQQKADQLKADQMQNNLKKVA